MKTKELRPIRETPEDYEKIERKIIELLRSEIYLPLIEILDAPHKVLKNSIEDLADAIRSERVRFEAGAFSGRFSSGISKALKLLGATWQNGKWYINLHRLPDNIQNEIRATQTRFQSVLSRIDARLSKILPEEIAEKLILEKLYDDTLWNVDKDLKSTMKAIRVPPDLTPERRAKIAEEYTNNMRLYIQEWTEKEIVNLRKEVQDHIFAGNRYEGLIKTIQKSYGVGQRKAKFLARQETNLLMAKFKESRYTDSGITHYKWKTVTGTALHPVRPRHRELDGRVFRFDDPPLMEDGNPKNPGEDYNCRCVAVPIIKF